MSCEIKVIHHINNLDRIIRHLFIIDNGQEYPENWLQMCLVSACPSKTTIVLVKEKRIAILKLEEQGKFDIYYVGETKGEDQISSVICLPLINGDSKTKAEVDWTCLAVGFQSGFVRFYTNDFILLYSQQFHQESVCSIKCQSQFSPRPDINHIDHRSEELFIHYNDAVCKINGERLFTILRFCYSKLSDESFEPETENFFNNTSFSKWGFDYQFTVNDSAVIGSSLSNTFDYLLAVSTYDGYNTSYKLTPPVRYSVMAAGSKPSVGFHYAAKYDEQHMFLTDVAKAVASKLKSALPSWFSGKQTTIERNTLAVQDAQSMNLKFVFHDLRRTTTSIILSQNRRLALVGDVLGRVLLINTHRGIVWHIFKGYRDAQCAFMEVREEERENKGGYERTATFVVIYSPKKGTLEVYCAPKVKKVAVFKVSKSSVLLYISHGLVGLTSNTLVFAKKFACQFTCILMDPDGNINNLQIPFYFALPEKDSRKARDIFLYKRLKYFVKNVNFNVDELTEKVLNIASEIETIDVHIECLNMLIERSPVHSDTILKFTDYLLDKYYYETDEIEDSVERYKNFILNLNKLSSTYVFLKTEKPILPKIEKTVEDEDESDNFDNENMSKEKMLKLQQYLDLMVGFRDKSFAYEKPQLEFFYEFLFIFDLKNEKGLESIKLKIDLEPKVLHSISSLIFGAYLFDERDDFDEFCVLIRQNKFCVKNLFEMLLYCWLHQRLMKDTDIKTRMARLLKVMVRLLQEIVDIEENLLLVQFNEPSVFWERVRQILDDSTNPFLAYCAALVCSNVQNLLQPDLNDSEEFQSVYSEFLAWSDKCNTLEQAALLDIVICNKFRYNDKYCTLPKCKNENLKVSIKLITEKGKGVISELVARWLANAGVYPDFLVVAIDTFAKTGVTKNVEEEYLKAQNDFKDELRYLKEAVDFKELKLVFCQLFVIVEEFYQILDSDSVLVHMCWEYANAWKKHLQEMAYLEASLTCSKFIKKRSLREGLMCLLWNTFLKIKFVNISKFLNITGQLPSQMLCIKETELSDLQIKNFLMYTSTFLDTLFKIKDITEDDLDLQPLTIDINFWKGPPSLVEVAFKNRGLNYPLVYVHFQLSRMLELMVSINIKKKFTKPIDDVFDLEVVDTFYRDFRDTVNVKLNSVDTKTHKARRVFLIKLIMISTRAIPASDNKVDVSEHLEFGDKVMELAGIWNLDVCECRRIQIVQLYVKGCDREAYSLMSNIHSVEEHGLDFLRIAAKRMYMIIMDSANPMGNQTCLSVDLLRYMKENLNESKDWCARGDLASVKYLATYAYRSFTEGTFNRTLCRHLLEAVELFDEIEASNAQLLIDKQKEREEALAKLGY